MTNATFWEIFAETEGGTLTRRVTVGPCPFCGPGLSAFWHSDPNCVIVSDVLLPDGHFRAGAMSVACGNCGARGPWGEDEIEAVQMWNVATRTETTLSEPVFRAALPPFIGPPEEDDIPF